MNDTPRRLGKWRVSYKFGSGTYVRHVTDDELLDVLGDRYGIVNTVVYEGPEVEATNRKLDAALGVSDGVV